LAQFAKSCRWGGQAFLARRQRRRERFSATNPYWHGLVFSRRGANGRVLGDGDYPAAVVGPPGSAVKRGGKGLRTQKAERVPHRSALGGGPVLGPDALVCGSTCRVVVTWGG